MKRIIFLLFLTVIFLQNAWGQVSFVFVPEVYARTVDGLGVFQVQNTGTESLRGTIQVKVRENINGIDVLTAQTLETIIPAGITNFPKGNFTGGSFFFASNDFARIASQTRNFPPGEYSICYRFIPSEEHGSDEEENCFEASVQPLVPISLVSPEDHDSICIRRPLLSWQPPMPYHPSTRFRLLLTEKRQGESVENLLVNAPLVLLDNISAASVNYPATSPDLKEGKTYCWQVIAYQQGVIISRSEIWEFTIKCKEADAVKPTDSYRELKFLLNGNYYIANQYIKFAFRNNYQVKKLNYSIIDIGNGYKPVKDLPEIAINPGLNNIDLDLTELGLEDGKQYLLKVFPFNEQDIEIRFVYHENSQTF